jgi:hypothetical protein
VNLGCTIVKEANNAELGRMATSFTEDLVDAGRATGYNFPDGKIKYKIEEMKQYWRKSVNGLGLSSSMRRISRECQITSAEFSWSINHVRLVNLSSLTLGNGIAQSGSTSIAMVPMPMTGR